MRRHAFAVGLLTGILLAGTSGVAQAGCRGVHLAPTKITHRAPPAAIVSHMAVLRRPQEPGDLSGLDLARFPYRLIARDYVRKLGEAGGVKYYLIPGSPTFFHLPHRCLRRLSPHRRRLEQRIERQGRRRSRAIGLGLFGFGHGGGGGGCCSDLHALLSGRTVQTSGNGHSVVSALVPDGVASVTLRWHRGPERHAVVTDNFWHTTVPLSPPHAFPQSTIWRDADGRLVRSFRAPGGR